MEINISKVRLNARQVLSLVDEISDNHFHRSLNHRPLSDASMTIWQNQNTGETEVKLDAGYGSSSFTLDKDGRTYSSGLSGPEMESAI